MSHSEPRVTKELQELTAGACDGDLSDHETARLEALLLGSAEARSYYLRYLHLHGELHWQQAVAADTSGPASAATGPSISLPAPVVSPPRRDRVSRLRLIGFLASAVAAVVLLVLAYRALPDRQPAPQPPTVPVAEAKLSGAVQPRWQAGAPAPAIGQAVPLDRPLVLERGTIEITDPSGTRLLIKAPAAFRFAPGGRLELQSGRVAVLVTGTPSFELALGGASVVPESGTIGALIEDRAAEVHVFEGSATLYRTEPIGGTLQESNTALASGEAARWIVDTTSPLERISAVPTSFPRQLPDRQPDRSVAQMRSLVTRHSHLIHHYTFEGTSRVEKCRDKQGSLHLTEAVMHGGRGRGLVDYTAEGIDLTTEAIRPHREGQNGNEIGSALQSEVRFHCPQAMTVELLLKYELPTDVNDDSVALALATRDADVDCGFFVAAAGEGYLSLLLDAEADWLEMDMQFKPDHWYYLAVTFDTGQEDTIVSAYAADLTAGQRQLQPLVVDEVVAGVPAVSRLGIGKGFDYAGAHAYPWPGSIDEVAIYDAVLDQVTLQQRIDVLLP